MLSCEMVGMTFHYIDVCAVLMTRSTQQRNRRLSRSWVTVIKLCLQEVSLRQTLGRTARRLRKRSAAIHRRKRNGSGPWVWRPIRRWLCLRVRSRHHWQTWKECWNGNTYTRVAARWQRCDRGSTIIQYSPGSFSASSKIVTVCSLLYCSCVCFFYCNYCSVSTSLSSAKWEDH